MVGQHERLKIWQKSYDLARDLIQASEHVRRVYQRLRQMESGTYKGDARASISSWIGYVKHADTYGLKCRIAERHPYLRVAFEPIEELK